VRHGASGGCSTLGLEEPRDVDAAVRAAKVIHPGLPVVTIGWSLGGAAALLHAGLFGGVAGAVGISSPAWSSSVDRPGARRVARWAGSAGGRLVLATLLRTRVCRGCPEVPDSGPVVDAISPAFILLVHDPADSYFGPEHPEQIMAWARDPKELWWAAGGGHGTDLLTPALAGRILDHVRGRLAATPERSEPGVLDREAERGHEPTEGEPTSRPTARAAARRDGAPI
jgi:pimeloyl-ACP methyl ester carboxylesterase